MRQVLINSKGAFIARVPQPTIDHGSVLVRVHYSLISVGTEIAGLRAARAGEDALTDTPGGLLSPARRYLIKALRNPRKAARRLVGLAKSKWSDWRAAKQIPEINQCAVNSLCWTRINAEEMTASGAELTFVTDTTASAYQVCSNGVPVSASQYVVVELNGEVAGGILGIGILNARTGEWLEHLVLDSRKVSDQIVVDPRGETDVKIVFTNTENATSTTAKLDQPRIRVLDRNADGSPVTELDQIGWNVGYSVSGEVVAVGPDVTDLAPGDWVACSGAGQANHADFTCVKRNLVCRVPRDCPLPIAATATVGAIALQGVRRADPQLGDVVCVLGLGLIGQLTAQLLRANGCIVLGLDLSLERINKARQLGLDDGAADLDAFKQLVRDRTFAHGADKTIITAATKSSALVNAAMELTRRKGTVVVVGDVGLHLERNELYRKEIDLRVSTSYGPGRYDESYEQRGIDYPYAYVRWTLNRNVKAYLELAAAKRINVEPLIASVVPITQAPQTYEALARSDNDAPLGVLLHYPSETEGLSDSTVGTKVQIRGHQREVAGPLRYALVGAGAFGCSMLVPQMEKRKDLYFLKGVVSRDPVRGGNFARDKRVEVLATNVDAVLDDHDFDLVVIATRHHEHAGQVVASLRAGKHVFVEKPLALTWDELDSVVTTYHQIENPPALMVGYNRRFSAPIQLLKRTIEHRRSPVLINYRLNGGYVPLNSWIQSEHGGGRNLGEACHVYDLFRFLIGAQVENVVASAIDAMSLPYLRNDNFTATISYADGSLATLTYTALGPKNGLSKERLELFCDGEAFVLTDYRSLFQASAQATLWRHDAPQKGHLDELTRFGESILKNRPTPIPFDELIETSAVSLLVEDLIHGRMIDDQQRDFAA